MGSQITKDILTKLVSIGKCEFDIGRLALGMPYAKDDVIIYLGKLVREGKVKLIIRVTAPSGQKAQDFSKLDDVPSTLIDPANQQPFTVTTDQLQLVYQACNAKN